MINTSEFSKGFWIALGVGAALIIASLLMSVTGKATKAL